MLGIIPLPVHRPVIMEYETKYSITQWLGEKSINIVIRKNVYWQEALYSIYIYQRGGAIISYYDKGKNPGSYSGFFKKIGFEEKKIIRKWLDKIKDKTSYLRTLKDLSKKSI